MTTLTVTAKGQVTFRKDVLKHLGIQPGDRVTLDLLPGGRAQLSAESPKATWESVCGMFKSNGRHLTIEEINDVIAEAGAAAGMGKE